MRDVTDIAFHFGVPDRLLYTCRLLRKAVAARKQVLVLADEAMATALDLRLWDFSKTDFVPHCQSSAPPSVRQRSPVLLANQVSDAGTAQYPVLVNLGASVPEGWAGFARVIEIVSADGDDRPLARERWRQYTRMGGAITRHDYASDSSSTRSAT